MAISAREREDSGLSKIASTDYANETEKSVWLADLCFTYGFSKTQNLLDATTT